ncbi:hypothetical protein OS493_000901 [Desmophyllum pertusum]|uniref:Uncharacterized protein n=1 Tax=Desmophyllum pertusum TaxID=174260 RepID=A0A9X0D4Z9_9CNID|nr:hypothetical protein OS493_000901 [Desmophyllum pertusum]
MRKYQDRSSKRVYSNFIEGYLYDVEVGFENCASIPVQNIPPTNVAYSPNKVKPPIRSDEEQPLIAPKKVVKRTVEGIIPSVYCPVQPVIPAISFTNTLTKQLQSISSDTQLLQILPSSSDPFTFQLVKSKFGDVPKGSVLSYQQKPDANSSGGHY